MRIANFFTISGFQNASKADQDYSGWQLSWSLEATNSIHPHCCLGIVLFTSWSFNGRVLPSCAILWTCLSVDQTVARWLGSLESFEDDQICHGFIELRLGQAPSGESPLQSCGKNLDVLDVQFWNRKSHNLSLVLAPKKVPSCLKSGKHVHVIDGLVVVLAGMRSCHVDLLQHPWKSVHSCNSSEIDDSRWDNKDCAGRLVEHDLQWDKSTKTFTTATLKLHLLLTGHNRSVRASY